LTANLSSFYNRRSITEPYLLFKVRNGNRYCNELSTFLQGV